MATDWMAALIEGRLRISLPTRDDLGHIAEEVAAEVRRVINQRRPEEFRIVKRMCEDALADDEDTVTVPRGTLSRLIEAADWRGPTPQPMRTCPMMPGTACSGERCGWWDDEGTCAIVAQVRRGRRP